MATTSEAIARNTEGFVRLHKALLKAFDTFEHEQDKAVEMMQEYLELDTEVLKADAYGRYTPNPEINVKAVQTFWDAMNEIGYIDSDLDITEYIDESCYDEALKQMLEENPDNEFYKEVAKGGYGSHAE